MPFPKSLNQLCTPSYVYFIISILGLVVAAIQNLGNTQMYCLGNFSCRVPSTIAVFILKLVYIMFWTWILNLMCKDGEDTIAWLLVLLPFILLFVILGMIMLYQKDEEKKQKKQKKQKKYDEDFSMYN